jgi:hypothetical protein
VQLRTSGLSRSDSARYSSVVFRSECPSHFFKSSSDAPSRCRDVANVRRKRCSIQRSQHAVSLHDSPFLFSTRHSLDRRAAQALSASSGNGSEVHLGRSEKSDEHSGSAAPRAEHFRKIISHRHQAFLTIFAFRIVVVDDVKHFAFEINVHPASLLHLLISCARP